MKELYTVEPDDGTTFQAGGEFTIKSHTGKYMYCDLSKGTKITLGDHPSYFKFQKGGDGFNLSQNWGAIVFNRSPMGPRNVELYKLQIEENTNPTANVIAIQDGTPVYRRGTNAFMFYKNADGTYRIASPEIGLSGTPTQFLGLDRDTYSQLQTTLLPGTTAENWTITFTGKSAITATVSPPSIISGGVINLPPIDVGGVLGISTPSPYTDAQWFQPRNDAPTVLTFAPGPLPPMFGPPDTTNTPAPTPAPSPVSDNSFWIWIAVVVGVVFFLAIIFMLISKRQRPAIKK